MRNAPRLTVVCNRCGKPRGIRHDCISNSRRKATLKPAFSFGKCEKCKKTITNPLMHTCAPKSDFKARKARAARREKARDREKARKKQQADKHDYQTCKDDECKRPLCVAFKTGWKLGYQDGFRDGFEAGYRAGYAAGFVDGIAACPRAHSG